MKLLVVSYVLVCSLWCSVSAFAQEQQQATAANITVSASSALAPSTSATFQEAYSQMLDTFPQKVLSTIGTILENSTNATSQGEQKDSLLKKDNLALQMGLWSSGSANIGAKYWLSELTAVRLGVSVGVDIGGSVGSEQRNFMGFYARQQDTVKSTGLSQGLFVQPKGAGNVNIDIGIFAVIEKHIFPYRNLSPYIGFGLGIDVYSRSNLRIDGSVTTTLDTNGTDRYFGGVGYIRQDAKEDATYTSGNLYTTNSVTASCRLLVGAEYFILNSLSINAQAAIAGYLTASLNILSENRSDQQTYKSNQANYYNRNANSVNTNLNGGVNSAFGVSGGINFSSSLTLSLYFGRNVLGDIVNAFKSGTLFQW